MKKIVRVSSDLRSNLVAYLDGELEEDESRDVEMLLAQSEVARHDVEMLSRSFDLLEMLPREKASDTFTQQTLASVAALDKQIPLVHQRWFGWLQRGLAIFLWVTVLAVAGFGGYVVGQQVWPSHSEQILEDLPLYQNLHLYQEIGDIEFLDQLEQRQLEGPLRGEFPEEMSGTEEVLP